jgi:exonuclease III
MGKDIWTATLNVHGVIQKGKREEVETWMKKKGVKILFLQETYVKQNSRESRDNYTWYFSGENPILETWTAGVGVVIENSLVKNILDIEPVNDRLIKLVLNGTIPITMLGVYIPQAGRPEEEKDRAYKAVEENIRKAKSKGPLYIFGDLNARIQKAESNREKRYIGEYTFEPETANRNRSEQTQSNRRRIIKLCIDHNLRVMNTMFRKQKEKLATYREVGTPIGWTCSRQNIRLNGNPFGFEQIDYVLATERWKNTVKDCETDNLANITTTHYPVCARINIRLKAIKTAIKRRKKYIEN